MTVKTIGLFWFYCDTTSKTQFCNHETAIIAALLRTLYPCFSNQLPSQVREAHDCFEERVQDVEEEMDVLRKEKEEKEAKLREVTTTFQALSTYFKEKEDGLHCRLSELQVLKYFYIFFINFVILLSWNPCQIRKHSPIDT